MSAEPAGPAEAGLSVVIPCYNEIDNVDHVCAEVLAELGHLDLELIFVDDGSSDGTLDAIKRLAMADSRVHYISFTRNFGFEAAFSAGYRYARRPWILHLDADQQFPAAEARRLIEVAGHGYDAVFGVRNDRKDPLARRLGTAAFHFVAARMLRIELPKDATAFRLVRTSLARKIVDLRLGTPYFLATVPRLTSRYTTVPVEHRARLRGESKVGLRWLAGHAIGLFVSVGRRLTTLASVTALGASALALLFALLAATGLLAPAAGGAALFVLVATALGVLGLTVRFLVVIAASQARPRLFYVREATVPVDAADLLFGPADPAPTNDLPEQRPATRSPEQART
ncbi:MAG: glycosyltransferase [Actinophytocola sp.]|uniref:glycosyltransferase family 2 protein n=1 Tax=Actinophytocola sp. TaxID=1872138 RepID=UPI001322FE67|nr:glycosyltransferase family 2 protein [Actinophytocola sp.]MPZ82675.1 glycosyltransferase [Actinophytocola sp.]